MANIARLGVILGLSSTEFVQGIDRAKGKTRELEADFTRLRAGLAVVGTAFVATTMKVLQFADQMSDASDAYQVSVRGILDISKSLEKAGGSFDNAGRMLGQFSNKVDEAASGSKQAQEAFGRIGISLKDLETLSVEDLLAKTAGNLAKIEDPLTRNAIAFDVFGRAIRGVDIRKFSEELNNGSQATDKQVAAVQELAQYMERLESIMTQVKLTLAEALLPILKFADIQMRDFGGAAEIVGKTIGAAFDGAVASITFIVESIKWAIASLANLNTAAAALMTGGSFWDTLKNLGSENNQRFLNNLKDMQNALKGGTPTSDSSGTGRKVTPYEDKSDKTKLANLLKQLETLKFISVQFETQMQQQVLGIELQTEKLGMVKNEAEIYQAMYEVERKRAEEVAKLVEKRKEAVAAETDQSVIAQIDTEILKINEFANQYSTAITNAIIANQMLQQSVEGGLLASYQKFQFEAINSAMWVERAVDSVFSNMTQAINQFVENGKFSFSDFAQSVIKDLIKIQLQMILTSLVSKAIGIGVSAFTNNALGPGFVGPMQPRAEGGNVFGNSPYLVGENGPELFIPSRSGTIVPNGDLGGFGNTPPQVVYNGPYIQNMNAIDTQSATQFLARNKDAVYAANMSASRSMPTSVR